MINYQKTDFLKLFPSPVFKGKITDTEFLQSLENSIRKLDVNNDYIKNKNGFQTDDNLQDLEDFKALHDFILDESSSVLDELEVERDSLYVTGMWANITQPNHCRMSHMHPNCILSGILYISTPENCGRLAFCDPRTNSKMIEPAYRHRNDYNSSVVAIQPSAGDLYIFPSWLEHAVEQGNNTAGDRICIAFNIMIKSSITKNTKSITF